MGDPLRVNLGTGATTFEITASTCSTPNTQDPPEDSEYQVTSVISHIATISQPTTQCTTAGRSRDSLNTDADFSRIALATGLSLNKLHRTLQHCFGGYHYYKNEETSEVKKQRIWSVLSCSPGTFRLEGSSDNGLKHAHSCKSRARMYQIVTHAHMTR